MTERRRTTAQMQAGWAARGSEHELGGRTERNRSRTDVVGAGRRKRRSNPARSVPHTAPDLAIDPRPPPVMVILDDLGPQVEIDMAATRSRDRVRGVPVYGQFPRGLIAALLPWLRCERHEIVHVCSGALPPGEGIRVDIRPDAHPDIVADGRDLPFATGSIAAMMIDPPYTTHYARELYNVDYPRPAHLIREARRVLRPGGRLAFVHYITPTPPPGLHFVKGFGLSTGFNMPIRALSIYERAGRQRTLEFDR